MKNLISGLCVAVLAVLVSGVCSAQTVLFQDQMTDPNAWGINISPITGTTDNDVAATFDYDYSADGIPEAPNTQGGNAATRGVKLEANNGDVFGVASFFTLYPLGQNFTGNYTLEFDMWMNYSTVDREDGGGAGTTEFGGGGIGYDNVTADIASGAQAMVTNEAGSSNDYRAFKSPPQFFIPDADMVAGTHNASGEVGSEHYTDFFPKGSGAPPVSQGQSPSDPNTNFNRAGAPGFQWFTWRVSVKDDIVLTQMVKPGGDTLDIVVYDKTVTDPNAPPNGDLGVDTDGNISIFYADFFSSVTANPALTFGLVDNVVVSEALPGDFDFDGDVDGEDFLLWQLGGSPFPLSAGDLTIWETNLGNTSPIAAITAVPEPASCALLLLSGLTIVSLRRNRH